MRTKVKKELKGLFGGVIVLENYKKIFCIPKNANQIGSFQLLDPIYVEATGLEYATVKFYTNYRFLFAQIGCIHLKMEYCPKLHDNFMYTKF